MITKEQYDKLQEFDRPLMTAYRAGYAHIAPSDLRKVLKIYYGEDWDKCVPKNVFSCSHCKLKELTKIATEYFNYEQC